MHPEFCPHAQGQKGDPQGQGEEEPVGPGDGANT